MRHEVNFKSIVKLIQGAYPDRHSNVQQRREMLADLCRLVGRRLKGESTALESSRLSAIPAPLPHLAPRVKETLRYLLAGDSEKQIAQKLRISRHTVHVYVKKLYVQLNVASRGELLAKFVGKVVMLDVPGESTTKVTDARRLRRNGDDHPDSSRATA